MNGFRTIGAVLTTGLLLASCAHLGGSGDAPVRDGLSPETARMATGAGTTVFELAQLPVDSWRTDGSAPLYLHVELAGDHIASITAADADTGNLGIWLDADPDQTTLIALENRTSARLKVDLHVSTDGERFAYTSSCPIGAQAGFYQRWPQPLPWLSVGNIRIIADDSSLCD